MVGSMSRCVEERSCATWPCDEFYDAWLLSMLWYIYARRHRWRESACTPNYLRQKGACTELSCVKNQEVNLHRIFNWVKRESPPNPLAVKNLSTKVKRGACTEFACIKSIASKNAELHARPLHVFFFWEIRYTVFYHTFIAAFLSRWDNHAFPTAHHCWLPKENPYKPRISSDPFITPPPPQLCFFSIKLKTRENANVPEFITLLRWQIGECNEHHLTGDERRLARQRRREEGADASGSGRRDIALAWRAHILHLLGR